MCIRDSKIAAPRLQALRAITGTRHHEVVVHVSSDVVLRTAAKLPMLLVLRLRRLAYLCRVLLHGPDLLIALLQQARPWGEPWCDAIVGDIKWLGNLGVGFRGGDEDVSLGDVLFFVVEDPRRWYRLLARANTKATELWVAEKLTANGSIIDASAEPAVPDPPPPYAAEGGHLCEVCGKIFDTAVGRGSHQRWVHGIRHRARLFAKSPSCAACLRYLWRRSRVVRHLREAKTPCLA